MQCCDELFSLQPEINKEIIYFQPDSTDQIGSVEFDYCTVQTITDSIYITPAWIQVT